MMPKQPSHVTDRAIASSCAPLIRGTVNVIACFEGRTIDALHDELGELMARPGAHIENLKSGRAMPRDSETAILATAGAQRGYLTRSWGVRLLQAAHYGGDRAALLDRLWPNEIDHTTAPALIAHNLPAPLYQSFVMRARAFGAVVDALRQRGAVVALVSMGGMGKTSLAREIAERCFAHPGRKPADAGLPAFNAIVWISDKDHPGQTTLPIALDTIAITLGYPSWTRFEQERKRQLVENLLKGQPVLLVLDNAETIVDDNLLPWLLRLPEPSKALLTTRVYRPELRQGAWLVELDGMSELEARQFITHRSQRYGAPALPDTVRSQLIAFAGGNPQVIDIILGIHRDTDQPIGEIIAQGDGGPDAAIEALLAASWAALRDEGRIVLMALVLFPTSAGDQTLQVVTDLERSHFFTAITQLKNLALIETERAEDAEREWGVRRSLHPLVRQFVELQLSAHGAAMERLRTRWLAWAADYAGEFGYLFTDVGKLQELNRELPTITAAIDWASRSGDDAEVVRMAKGIEFAYYVRALWGPKLALHEQYIAAAIRLRDPDEEIAALAMHIQLLSRQGYPEQAAGYLPRLRQLAGSPLLRGETVFQSLHAEGLYSLAAGQLSIAERAWRQILDRAVALALPDHMLMGAQHWLGTCLARAGHPTAARAQYQAALELARASGYERMIARNQIQLALLDADDDRLEQAWARLHECEAKTAANDWEQRAWLRRAQGRLHALTGERSRAEAALKEAIDQFERMGLTYELMAAQAELDALNMGQIAS